MNLNIELVPGTSIEEGPGGLPVLVVATPAANARIFLHGAQLTHWQPTGAEPVIWMSGKSLYQEGKAIRGGVPVCFPWFGPREGQQAHGFVRNKSWELSELTRYDNGEVRAVFTTTSDAETLTQWAHAFVARLAYTVGPTLKMSLEVENTSDAPFTFSEALHTYFAVGAAQQAFVTGLDGAQYRDYPDRSVLVQQTGPIHFTEETDRVYVNTQTTCVLEDPVMARRIIVEKHGSDTTTVWNPWIAKAKAMADFGDEEWPEMVCIETVNSAENSVTLAPGAKHAMTAHITVEAR